MDVDHSKMRLGIISAMWGASWGGSEELWAALAQRALEKGIFVSICLPFRQRSNHKHMEALESAGADVFCHSDSRLYVRARQFSRVVKLLHRGLAGYLREHLSPLPAFFSTRPDVLLVNEGWSIPSIEVLEAVQRYHVPRPYLILSQANGGDIPGTEHRRRTAAFYKDARFSLFVSESNLRATERQLTQRLVNARVVKNPVNLDCVDPVPWPQEKSINFASVARLNTSDKGQDILFEALSDHQWRRRDWHLSLYGSGEHDVYLRELSTFFGLNERVMFRGQVEDIREVWHTHHALVLPSRVEGTPLAMVEAMLCGRPVIGTAVSGISEWVREGRNGFLADAPVVSCFAATLETAWQQRAQWQSMGNDARHDALLLYDPAPGDTLLSIVVEAAHANQRICQSRLEKVAP
jgi:glycosyltransferase involved in cell wall biosynthesis